MSVVNGVDSVNHSFAAAAAAAAVAEHDGQTTTMMMIDEPRPI